MADPGADAGPEATLPAHEIRRFESAIWSLYMLSDNPSLPIHCRAACRAGADFASGHMTPEDKAVRSLVQLVIDVGGAETPPSVEEVLARLRQVGWQGSADDLAQMPPPLAVPPPRTLVSDKMRKQALDKILAECERHLRDPELQPPRKAEYAKRLHELRDSKGDVRTKTERAWELLDVLERNIAVRGRESGPAP